MGWRTPRNYPHHRVFSALPHGFIRWLFLAAPADIKSTGCNRLTAVRESFCKAIHKPEPNDRQLVHKRGGDHDFSAPGVCPPLAFLKKILR
jgi:hypothetical protein